MYTHVTKPRLKGAAVAGFVGVSAAALIASATPASAAAQVTLQGTNGAEHIACQTGNYGVRSDIGGVTSVSNGCGVRVWLEQFSDGSGWHYCISPHADVSLPGNRQFPRRVYVSTNTAHC